MAQDSAQVVKEDRADKARLEFAVREIEQSESLRYLVREFLSFCGTLHPTSTFNINPQLSAYNEGVRAAGIELSRILNEAAPLLLPALMIEDMTNAQDAVAKTSD